MKRIIVFLMLLGIVVLTSPVVYAGDIDGIWGRPGSFDTLYMVRENSGVVIAAVFDLANYNAPNDFIAYVGNQYGSAVHLVDTVYNMLDAEITLTLTSANSGTVYINSCTSKSPYYYCTFPSGTYFDIEKLF